MNSFSSGQNDVWTQDYHAPKPSNFWKKWAKIIAARIFFPPILLWDAIRLCARGWVGKMVVSPRRPCKSKSPRNQYFYIKDSLGRRLAKAAKLTVVTPDNAKLDTFHIIRHDSPVYIIYFVGNGVCYEDIRRDEMMRDALMFRCNVIGFNFRGVSNSTSKPRSKNDLVTDGIAQVQRLLDGGVNPENIVLNGHSLGGAVATLVAAHFHTHEKKVRVFNDRSFSTITNFIVGQIRGPQETFTRKIVGWLAKPWIKLILTSVNWEIDAASAYKNLPDSHKKYVVIRSQKALRNEPGNQPKDDGVILPYASLHKGLEKSQRSKESKMFLSNSTHIGKDQPLHCMPLDVLKNRKMNATNFFGHFVLGENPVEQDSASHRAFPRIRGS